MKESLNQFRTLSPKKYALLAGTLLLTCAGLITRILGFFYRIFLSRAIGAEGLGIFNLIHPVFGICFALCAGSIQTAISQSVAANVKKGRSIFRTGLLISLSTSIVLAWFIYKYRVFLATSILLEPRCAPLLIYIAVSVPWAAVHACINGYYYGMQKTRVPAFAQVVEQSVRIGAIFLIADIMMEQGITITVQLAAMGHLIGEVIASMFTVFCLQFFPPKHNRRQAGTYGSETAFSEQTQETFKEAFLFTAPALMTLALPLMGNRLVLNLLASAEAIWIPGSLQNFGLTDSEALNIYGVLTGMALPFILFPSTIFNSLAVLLLPTVAKAQSDGNQNRISSTISMSLRYSLYIGILCIGVFTMFGNDLGFSVFKDRNAGSFITILAWLCPFLYLATTMGSILNGLGRTSTTFIQNVAALLVRLFFVLAGIPRFGIYAYLIGMLASELFLAVMHICSLKKLVAFTWNAYDMIIKPALLMILSIGIYLACVSIADPFASLPLFLKTAIHIAILSFFYLAMLLFAHITKPQPKRLPK